MGNAFMLFHVGLPDASDVYRHLCMQPGGEGDTPMMGAYMARLVSAENAARDDVPIPHGVALCVRCAQMLRARGQVPHGKHAFKVIDGGKREAPRLVAPRTPMVIAPDGVPVFTVTDEGDKA